MSSEAQTFELTNAEVKLILKREPRPLIRDENPRLEKGHEIVVETFPSRVIVAGGKRVTVPEERSVWITITSVVRTTKGHWAVRYDVTDRRDLDQANEYLAPKLGYTADPNRSIDPETPVPDRERVRFTLRKPQVDRWREQRDQLERALTELEKDHGRDAKVEVRVIRRRLDALDRKIQRTAA